MNPSPFEFRSYKDYLRAWLEAQPKAGHGLRRKMALSIGTQTGFITQVLGGNAHFSPEQILALSQMMGHSPDETQFLQMLLQLERAGTPDYRKHVERLIEKVIEDRKVLSQRLKAQHFPSDVDQVRYFSSWTYACVHVMTTCERFQTSKADMAEALGLPLEMISQILEFLIHAGLVREENGRYVTGSARLHLGTDSPYLSQHHRNWNLKAVDKLGRDVQTGLHYSSVVTLAPEDIEHVKETFMQAIEKSKKIVRESKGERVSSITLNFFEIC